MLKIACFQEGFDDAVITVRQHERQIFLPLRFKSDFLQFKVHLGPILLKNMV